MNTAKKDPVATRLACRQGILALDALQSSAGLLPFVCAFVLLLPATIHFTFIPIVEKDYIRERQRWTCSTSQAHPLCKIR